jgi:hypothetical protein
MNSNDQKDNLLPDEIEDPSMLPAAAQEKMLGF